MRVCIRESVRASKEREDRAKHCLVQTPSSLSLSFSLNTTQHTQAEWPAMKEAGLDFGAASTACSAKYKVLPEEQKRAWKQRALDESGLPEEKPKAPKPLTAFNCYIKDQIPAVKPRFLNPQGKFVAADAMKELASVWKTMTDSEKQPYQDQAAAHNATIKSQ